MTLAQWLIQKTNSEAYRAGRLTGWKHPKVDRALIEVVGGREKLLEQAALLEKDREIGGSGKFKNKGFISRKKRNKEVGFKIKIPKLSFIYLEKIS